MWKLGVVWTFIDCAVLLWYENCWRVLKCSAANIFYTVAFYDSGLVALIDLFCIINVAHRSVGSLQEYSQTYFGRVSSLSKKALYWLYSRSLWLNNGYIFFLSQAKPLGLLEKLGATRLWHMALLTVEGLPPACRSIAPYLCLIRYGQLQVLREESRETYLPWACPGTQEVVEKWKGLASVAEYGE